MLTFRAEDLSDLELLYSRKAEQVCVSHIHLKALTDAISEIRPQERFVGGQGILDLYFPFVGEGIRKDFGIAEVCESGADRFRIEILLLNRGLQASRQRLLG